jgi:hypothetical protein
MGNVSVICFIKCCILYKIILRGVLEVRVNELEHSFIIIYKGEPLHYCIMYCRMTCVLVPSPAAFPFLQSMLHCRHKAPLHLLAAALSRI